MPLEKQIVQLNFEGAEQRLGNKHLVPGQLTLAQNVYQTKTREYRKRNGYGTITRTADYDESGNLSSNITEGRGLTNAGGALVLRGKQSAYRFDATANEWIFTGSVDRSFPRYTRMLPNAGNIPTMAIDGSNNAVMVAEGTDRFLYFSVVNLNDGTVIIPMSRLVGPAQNDTNMTRLVFAGGSIWLIRWSTSGGIVSHQISPASYKFFASGTSIGAGTTIFNSGTIRGFDIAPSTQGTFIVVYGAPPAGAISFMFMDNSTGALKVSPGVVNTDLGGGGSTYFATVARNDTATNIFLFAAQTIGGTLTWKGVKLNPTTLAVVSTETSWSAGTGGATLFRISGGCHVIGGTRLVGLLSRADDVIENQILGLVDTSFGGATVTDNFVRASWMASDVFSIGGILHYVTAHDDENKLQTAYYLRRLTFPTGGILDNTIKARALYGLAGPINFNTRTGVQTTQGAALTYVSGNKVRMAVAEQATTAALTGTLLEFDTAEAVGPVDVCQDHAIFPAGWPQQIAGGRCVELSPMMFPRTVTITPGGGGSLAAGTYSFQALYAIREQGGLVYRSAPTPVFTTSLGANSTVTFTVPTLRVSNAHAFPGVPNTSTRVTVDIECYMSRVNTTTPKLITVIRNNPAADTVTSVVITTQPVDDAEAIYTTGDVISNSPVPPFRWSACWRNRVLVGGTDEDGRVWTSQELETGVGATFNEINVTLVQGRDYAGGMVDNNYFAIFTADGVWVISGNGPDAFGRGNYEPQKLPGTIGCTNPNSLATSPQGLYYQGTDGNIYLLTPSLEQTRISDGVFDFKAETVQAATTVAKAEQVRFFMSGGRTLVWDYGHRTQTKPIGQWYVWTAPTAAVGATVFNDVAHHIASDATVRKEVAGQYFDGVSTPILPKLTVAPISFAGIQGFERVWKGQFLGDFKAAHTVQITLDRNYGEASQVLSKAMTAGPQELEFRPAQQRVKALGVTIEQIGSDLTEAFTFETLAFEVGIYGALRPMPTGRKM